MKGFSRGDRLFSLCGLNCGLCPMQLDGYCPGCGGGEGNQPCAIARCSLAHGGVEYCFLCGEFPCERYKAAGGYDCFITRQNQLRDMALAREIGTEAYQACQAEKGLILKELLENYNDGRKKTFYCVAVNLLEIGELRRAMALAAGDAGFCALSQKEKAARLSQLFKEAGEQRGLLLMLRRKPKEGK